MPHPLHASSPSECRGEGMRGDALERELTIGLANELNIAPLGVGAWAWGTTRLWGYGKEYNRSDVGRAFRVSMAEGVTLFDTAEMYGSGASERVIGEMLREGAFEGTPVISHQVRPPPVPLERQIPSEGGRQESGATRDRDHRPLPDPLPESDLQDKRSYGCPRGDGQGRQGPPGRRKQLWCRPDEAGARPARLSRGVARLKPGRVQPAAASTGDERGARSVPGSGSDPHRLQPHR